MNNDDTTALRQAIDWHRAQPEPFHQALADRLLEAEVALYQAADMAIYVDGAAKGEMVKKVNKFLGLPYAQYLKAQLAKLQGA